MVPHPMELHLAGPMQPMEGRKASQMVTRLVR